MDGAAGADCLTERPADMDLPNFLRIDFAHKAIVGPKQTSPILFMDTSDIQLLLHGKEYVRNHGFSNSSLSTVTP